MGDPAGIGPEVILKVIRRRALASKCRLLIYGDFRWLSKVHREIFGGSLERYLKRHVPGYSTGNYEIVDFKNLPPNIRLGRATALGGSASGDYIDAATSDALGGQIQAVVTLPINKIAFSKGRWGTRFIGHTEMLTGLTGARFCALMLVYGRLRAVHVTSHIALSQVSRTLTKKRICQTIQLTDRGLRQMGIRNPRILVCAFNPHGGEGGLFGREERSVIRPAVSYCARAGMRVEGPLSADTVWPQVLAGAFDAGIAMYHDQGQIPVKLLSFQGSADRRSVRGVNVTLGLPIIRTSVVHGTAYDIAGKGLASDASLIDAIQLALKMAEAKNV